MKKILLIDVDDTILDFSGGELIAIKSTLKAFDLPTDDATCEIYHQSNIAMWQAYERGELSKPELVIKRFADFLQKINHSEIDPKALNEEYFIHLSIQHDYIEGAKEFLEKIKEFYRIILITNGTTDIQNSRLSLSGLENMVESIYISEQLGTKKPELSFFEIVAKNTPDFDKTNTVLVGDSLTSDILGGINFGVKTIWFNPKGKACGDIVPDVTVSNFDELYRCLTECE